MLEWCLVYVSKKHGRRPTKSTNFDNFWKFGHISLQIKDGHMKVWCENRNMLTNRVTWVIKHHVNMGYYQ